ncbi:Eco57I restriction-modification methylase domain-containing protein [Sorangium sp. So ce513]|uniref:Eco57I restriction-modification methylase domain-containing protein n=1 Tax=Sorangium sp. So ce513 TaxID=3133315 RepID=UPI003F61EFF8
MSDADKRFHEQWIGMAQPSEGLVVSVPVLVDAQCAEKLPREAHLAFLECLEEDAERRLRVPELGRLFSTVLDLDAERFDAGDALPPELSLYVVEGKQLLRPTRALRWNKPRAEAAAAADSTPAAQAGRPYAMLVWEVPPEVEQLDKPEQVTGAWEYPAQAKFERLLRECRVPIGLLSNGHELRLVYAPHGESSGWIAFRTADMASVSGRPIFDAFVMLLSRQRWFGVAAERTLPAILAESRKRNADVTTELSRQVFEALEVLLAGFAAAEERDGTGALRDALEREDEHLYAGLLTVLLRLVFLLYCEDRGLLPTEHPLFARNYSLLGLFDALQADFGKYPDTMHRRFGAYPRLVGLFRAVYLGVSHGELVIPARRGQLFDPNAYPFLEGWGPEGSAPITQAEARAAVKLPSVDDLTVYSVLEKLLYLSGQRLSYKALDVEQIGSVYEALMGFGVKRIERGAVRVRLGSKKGAARVWVEADALLAVPVNQRERWLQDELGFDKSVAAKIAEAVKGAKMAEEALGAMEPLSGRTPERAGAGTLVIQPGPERRRTSSHYTPRTLTEPIVERTLEPLIKAMGEAPSSETLLNLVVCDPAVGSGAFLVAACRYLADRVVAAWTREGRLEVIASAHEDVVNHARRLVAQRCLYGVDKNTYAVQLARLSLWLVTMARNEPFTFVDHAIRHGDSLVGLGFEQIRAFHWKPQAQVELSAGLLSEALDEAIGIRKRILALAGEGTYAAQREKELLLRDAEDALDRVRLVADLVVGAFFGQKNDKDRERERKRRLDRVTAWLAADKRGEGAKAGEILAELRGMQAEIRREQVPFHWMIEFPEVFAPGRADPLEGNKVTGKAFIDAFVGNPPFAGKNGISAAGGEHYLDWFMALMPEQQGRPNTDLCAYFFRRGMDLLGANGTLGLVATNTIAEGDSRLMSLKALVDAGGEIYRADANQPWPGDAAVTVSVVHIAFGSTIRTVGHRHLGGRAVPAIDSRLLPQRERSDPQRLYANKQISFMGGKLVGAGLAVTLEQYHELVASDPKNALVLRPYLGGEEVNQNPGGKFDRYMIDFTTKSLEEARAWPMLLRIAEEKVRPARERDKRGTYRTYWWRPGESGGAMYAALCGQDRCVVTARVTKHLMFSFQKTTIFFSEQLYVFALDCLGAFATLQSRIHEPWARLLSSSMKTDLRYAASDCFETFPFPDPDPRAVIPALEAIGEKLYETRARFMIDTDQGLTKTYNALKDPSCQDPRILDLRALHEEMDRAVLAAYGWSDIAVPPYCPKTDEERAAVQAFEDEVIDRLFVLNAQRAAQEKQAAAATAPAAKPTRGRAKKPADEAPAKPARKGRKRGGDDNQGKLDL